MTLPLLATEDDVQKIVDYLKTKATGATISDAKSALGSSPLDPRKISAYDAWGLITKEGNRLKLADLGRDFSRARPENQPSIYAQILRSIKPYRSTLDWMFHQGFDQVRNVEIAAHWHEHHRGDIGESKETTIKRMAVCFLHVCQGAGLGNLVIGRKGQETRFEISKDALGQFIAEAAFKPQEAAPGEPVDEEKEKEEAIREEDEEGEYEGEEVTPPRETRVFISHSKNMEIVEQIKTMLDLADMKYEVVEEEETTAMPVPEKVFSAMRKCTAAVICVTADENEKRDDGTYGVNQNVLIEIGAAFVLYDKKVVLVWDKDVPVPSNLQGLYRCEFSGDELSWSAGMKLMKAVANFKIKPARA